MEFQSEAKKKLLVVDDDPIMLRTIRGWLSEDYDVSVVTSGQTAFAFLKKFTPDLILLDYEMPVMSGAEVFKKLCEDESTSSLPVIFLTGRDDEKGLEEIKALNPKGCILKTRTPAEVKQYLESFFLSAV
ncbi:MAG: response regulator [Treponema sp.]|nr:response regulator [Treponema sp.]